MEENTREEIFIGNVSYNDEIEGFTVNKKYKILQENKSETFLLYKTIDDNGNTRLLNSLFFAPEIAITTKYEDDAIMPDIRPTKLSICENKFEVKDLISLLKDKQCCRQLTEKECENLPIPDIRKDNKAIFEKPKVDFDMLCMSGLAKDPFITIKEEIKEMQLNADALKHKAQTLQNKINTLTTALKQIEKMCGIEI